MQIAMPVDELIPGDKIMYHTDILTVVNVTLGTVKRTGVRFGWVYFADKTSIGFSSDEIWYTTVFNA